MLFLKELNNNVKIHFLIKREGLVICESNIGLSSDKLRICSIIESIPHVYLQ